MQVGCEIVLKQRIGIPMGTNCAVYLANLYLFAYELDFVNRTVGNPAFHHIVHHFRWTKRYIDDLLAIDNPVSENYFYSNSFDASGLVGIDPSCLSLTSEQNSPSEVNFLDLIIFRRNGSGRLHTSIFDKRDYPPLSKATFYHLPSH